MGNWDVELDQNKDQVKIESDMNEDMLIEQVIKYFKRSLESSIRAYNNPNIYGEIKDLSEFDIKSLAVFEIHAYQRAIAALEAELAKKTCNNKQVSLDAVISIIEESKEDDADEWMGYPWKVTPNLLMDEVRKLPSVHAERTGHWIYKQTEWPTYWYECSCCGCEEKEERNYCPDCGAKMEEQT